MISPLSFERLCIYLVPIKLVKTKMIYKLHARIVGNNEAYKVSDAEFSIFGNSRLIPRSIV